MSNSRGLGPLLANLGLSGRKATTKDDDDYGEDIDPSSVAGGGHGARQSTITKYELRVSHELQSFLVRQGVLDEADIENSRLCPAICELLERSHIHVPPELTDRSHPFTEYFISSSHNTYLQAHQLYGAAETSAYTRALETGSRCVEIDAWDNEDDQDEPRVTHGYTLTSNIPFRGVCETIRDVVDKEAAAGTDQRGYAAAPIIISLENHCDAHGQLRLVQIMKEVFQHRLLSEAVRDKGTREQLGQGEHVTLADLGAKIVVIVEYYFPKIASPKIEQRDSSDDEDLKKAVAEATPQGASVIVPELAALGVYAQSVKPRDDSWYDEVTGMKDGPHHHLINVSESQLSSKLPKAAAQIARHNSEHLMRVYPKGTRIGSDNLDVIPYWGIGAQIVALNWQTFGAPLQLNEALFSGTDGFVLKPASLRGGGSLSSSTPLRRRRLRLHVAGATDVPCPEDRRDDIKPYLTCTLVRPAATIEDEDEGAAARQQKRKTVAYRRHKLTGALHHSHGNPPVTDPIWDEELEWEYEDDELVFLRLLIKSDDAFARNPIYAVTAVRLAYVVEGWNFVRMLDLKGRETHCSLLFKFVIEDV